MKKILNKNIFFFILLFVTIFIVYGKSVSFNLTELDDDLLITRNINYISDYKNIPNFFLTDCYFGKKTQYYRPVLNISFSLEAIFFKDNFKVYHFTDIFLFFLSLYLIFLFLSELNFDKNVLKFLILLFAVHPTFACVPVWIPARNDTLLTIFFISSLILFIKYLKTDKVSFMFLHLFFFALSLFTKETSLLLLFIYPLLVYCFNFNFSKKQISYNLSFIIPLLVIYFILRTNAVRTVDLSIYASNWHYYVKNIIFGTMIYIEKLFFPAYMPIMLYDFLPPVQTYIINIIFFTALIYVYYKKMIERKIIIFSIIFFFISIFPTFMQEEYALFFHRLITSLTAIVMILTVLLQKVIRKYPETKKYLIIIFVFFMLLFSVCSFYQIDKYKDGFSFWSNSYIDAKNYHLAYNGLAQEYCIKKDFEKAIELALKNIEIKNSYEANMTYATILLEAGNAKKAEEIFYQLLKIDNSDPTLYKNISSIFLLKNSFEQAIKYAEKAVELSPDINGISLKENLSKVYAVAGKYNESLQILLDLLQFDKNNDNYCYNISMLYEDLKNYEKSYEYIKKALKFCPEKEQYQNQLKNVEQKLLSEQR